MAGYQSPAHRYREIAITTANPLQLVVMLYDAAIHSAQEAQEHLRNGSIDGRSRSINKCIAVISELQMCLDMKAGGEIAGSLDRLYDYMKRGLVRANAEQSIAPLTEIEALLDNLRSAWRELVAQNPGDSAPGFGSSLTGDGIASPAATPTGSFNVSA